MKAEIKKNVLAIDGEELELSLEQAKALRGLFAEMFSEKIPAQPLCPITCWYSTPYLESTPNWYGTSITNLAANQAVSYTAGTAKITV